MPSLIGKALALRSQGPPVPMAPPSRGSMYSFPLSSGGPGDAESYMRAYSTMGTVWQIVHLLSSSTARPEWRLYRKNRDNRVRYSTGEQGSDQRTEVVQHQALSVLNRPSAITSRGIDLPVLTRFGLFEASQMYMDLTGESLWVLDYGQVNFPVGIWPVSPARMEPVPDPDVYLKGWVYTSPDGREKIPLQPHEVLQVKYPNPMDPYRGLGPVQAVLVDIQAARSSAEWNRNFFLNSAIPGGIIQVPNNLTNDEWDELTDRWRETHRGVGRAHRVAVLEAGAVWVPNQMSMRDMDFGTLRDQSRDIIREAFGIHKVMVGVSDDVNRANAQTGEEVFYSWKIIPRLDRWKVALNEQFLPLFGSTGQGVEFDYIAPAPQNREQDNSELLAKAQAAQFLVGAGYELHDVLEVVGLPDMKTTAAAAGGLPADSTPNDLPEGPPNQDAQGAGDSMSNLLRRVLNDGYVPIDSGRR